MCQPTRRSGSADSESERRMSSERSSRSTASRRRRRVSAKSRAKPLAAQYKTYRACERIALIPRSAAGFPCETRVVAARSNELTDPYEFNLMFPTPIGPSGMLQVSDHSAELQTRARPVASSRCRTGAGTDRPVTGYLPTYLPSSIPGLPSAGDRAGYLPQLQVLRGAKLGQDALRRRAGCSALPKTKCSAER
eukprot:1955420-Rhodomonas_salina.1